ncbi:hypothetical protein L6452_22309 [Arctium lappa]|uniref:Uncharacterized protein n=1 Tax=Arctium lappa TaxID=4217 RepID=A0ACB9B3Q6_ARCLA|nr:hypothetical protein L6452_22309 [Arctium lappa]
MNLSMTNPQQFSNVKAKLPFCPCYFNLIDPSFSSDIIARFLPSPPSLVLLQIAIVGTTDRSAPPPFVFR